ncbi:hypothetical protein CCP3SC15_1440011 [Gammaproteobacteria bacterium]
MVKPMAISEREWKALTESKFWRPDIGRQYKVIMSAWRFEMRTFKEELASKDACDREPRPTFVAIVTSINGEVQEPPKEFASSNKALNKQLMAAVMLAEKDGRNSLRLAMGRTDAKTYSIIDLGDMNSLF